MKNLLFPALLAISAALAATPVAAQLRSPTAMPGLRATPGVTSVPTRLPQVSNPGVSLSTPPTSPLQSQEQDNYATQLRAAQQQLLMQNPSGVTRPELGVSGALNGFTPR